MLFNYLKVAVRNLRKHRGYTLINLLGLAVGLACSILILLWVQSELAYDRFHTHGERIFRIMENQFYANNEIFTTRVTPGPLYEYLQTQVPEIEKVTRFNWEHQSLFTVGDKQFNEQGLYADSTFLQLFSFPVLAGNANTALTEPHTIVLTETLAKKYFQSAAAALNQSIKISNDQPYKVTAVVADVPENSHIQFSFLMPYVDFDKDNEWARSWGNNGIFTYILVKPHVSAANLGNQIRDIIKKHNEGSKTELFLQALHRVRLYSNYENGVNVGGRIEYVQLFSVVGMFVLVIACVNFMNLSTARSEKRAKEVGVRKVAGALRTFLMGQFLGEAVLVSLLALLLALGLVHLSLPFFNELVNKHLTINYLDIKYPLLFIGIALFTGLLAGSYPALYLSSFNPVQVLKGTLNAGKRAGFFRKILVVGQFGFSILLIIGTIVIYQQINYLKNRPLGYQKDHLLILDTNQEIQKAKEALKREWLQTPGIAQVTLASQQVFQVGSNTSGVSWEGKKEGEEILISQMQVGYDFVRTLGMRLKAGRDFSADISTDSSAVVINEKMAKVMQMENPVGQKIKFWGEREWTIVGVTEDFHFNSVYQPVEPLMMLLRPDWCNYLFVRLEANQPLPEVLASLEKIYKKHSPSYPFAYQFFDQEFARQYSSEQLLGKLANIFGSLAIFISCLGLFGLASFTAEQRTKEIGIRKVLGASIAQVMLLLSREFTFLVLIAFAIASPIAYYFATDWLNDFAYQIKVSPVTFMMVGLASLLLAWLTVGYQAFKAAMVNPVKSLRNE